MASPSRSGKPEPVPPPSVTRGSWLRAVAPGAADLLDYHRSWLRPDLLAGLSVWAVVVPQGLAYGELAGLSPVTGLYTAVAALMLYWLFGSSRSLHVGPESSVAIVTASFVAPLAGGDPQRAAALAALLALVAATFLVLGGLLRLAVISRLLSMPVLVGYLAGSAVIITLSQFGKALGVATPSELWWQKVADIGGQLAMVNPLAVGIAVFTVIAILALRRWAPRLPGILLAVAGATLAVGLFGWSAELPVVGAVEPGVPAPHLPAVTLDDAGLLLGAGASVALLIFASSILTALALAAPDGVQVNGRREFIGLAASSVGAGLMGGFPANATNSRSFIVVDAGARSQVANLTAAVLVGLTLLVLTPAFRYMPQAALAGVVLVAAIGMVDIATLRRLWHVRRSDFILAAVTFAGVLAVGVLPGIAVGVAVSLAEVLRRAIQPPTAVLGRVGNEQTYRDVQNYDGAHTIPGLLVYRFDAPLFFANADVLRGEVLGLVEQAQPPVRHVILDAEAIVDVDVTGAEALGTLADDLRTRGIGLALARARTAVQQTLIRTGVTQRLAENAFHLRVESAIRAFTGDDEHNS